MGISSLAVIPARAGSTRLKDKNIYQLGNKPLIRWITEAVFNSKCFDEVLISTDSDEIFDSVSDLPVHRHIRPDHLASTEATVLNAMLDLMDLFKEQYDIFAYFLPTCPFVSSDDIRKGMEKIYSADTDCVVSMTEIDETIQLACLMDNDRVLPVFDNLEHGLTNSKFIKKYYKPSGAFYIGKWDKILENKSFFKGNVRGVFVPKNRSIDINDIFDIQYAESILKHM